MDKLPIEFHSEAKANNDFDQPWAIQSGQSIKKIVMKAVHLDIKVSDVDQPARLETIVAKVMRDGFILNSIKSEISFSLKQTFLLSQDDFDQVQR